MAKISLHTYNREIENLIERGQTEEAIAHCKYILRQFPKHINTYRLLGKTYLESQRYSEAADILQRVLSSIPDDFVSQLGMSIIREDEGNLDAAIWHMERAYEVQPANTAIQDELRRLYGRRDGVEPPKVRLTRGALVRMYARGELFTQAIGEARAAIAEDPQRIDLEIILAQMYFLAGMKVEATEVCSRVVNKLPYCYEANRILALILPSTSRAEDAKAFQQNLNGLDPYAAFVSSSAPTSDQVPENAIQVERLDWTPSAEDQQPPEWARTVGVDYEQEKSTLPDWLDTLPASTLFTAPQHEEPAPPTEENLDFSADLTAVEPSEIPEWMREAGWSQATEETKEEPSSVFDLAGEGEEDLADAELPAWLKEMAPSDDNTEVTPEEQERLELLDSILPPGPLEEAQSGEMEQPETGGIQAEQAPQPGVVDDETQHADGDTPEWASDIDVVENSTIYKTGRTGALPKWLEEELETDSADAEQLPEEELPEWLRTIEEESEPILPEATVEEAGEHTPIGSGDEDVLAGIAWLESLAENQGVEAETLITAPEDRLETPPEWVTHSTEEQGESVALASPDENIQEEPVPEPHEAVTPTEKEIEAINETPVTEEITPVFENESEVMDVIEQETAESIKTGEEPSEDVQTDEETDKPFKPEAEILAQPATEAGENEDIDAALAWLEGLAERQGADEETLSVRPEDRLEGPPEWVLGEMEAVDQTIQAEEEPEVNEPGELSVEPTGTDPDALTEVQPLFDQGNLPVESPGSDLSEEDAFAWLESLAARQGAEEETLLTAPEERVETPPEWVYEETGEPADAIEGETVKNEADETGQVDDKPEWVTLIPEETQDEIPETETATEKAPTDWFAELPAIIPTETSESEENGIQDLVSPSEVVEETLPDWLTDLEPEEVIPQVGTGAEVTEWSTAIEETIVQPQVEPGETFEETAVTETELADEEDTQPVGVQPEIVERAEETAALDAFDLVEPVEPVGIADDILEEAQVEEGVVEEEIPEVAAPEKSEELLVEPGAEEALEQELPDVEMPSDIEPEPTATETVSEQLMSDDLPQTIREQAFNFLDNGQIDAAVEQYNQIIESGEMLETVIEDLRKALDRYPVDISIWQTLGDAYLRNDQVQEALDSYTKAEELLR
jgi:tetratricopeptide (TPR) repeat protein